MSQGHDLILTLPCAKVPGDRLELTVNAPGHQVPGVFVYVKTTLPPGEQASGDIEAGAQLSADSVRELIEGLKLGLTIIEPEAAE